MPAGRRRAEMCDACEDWDAREPREPVLDLRLAPRAREIEPSVPLRLEGIILKATAKRSEDRYTSAREMATDVVSVHYHGTLPDGKVFDSSVQRGQPAEFPLNQVIPCWTEGVQKMKVGGKARLVCPSTIAYGDQGRPPVIPGGATLVFEVELLEVAKHPAQSK